MNALRKLRNLPAGTGLDPLLSFVRDFDDPQAVAREVLRLIEHGSDDPLVAPPDAFTRRPRNDLFENWEYPVNAHTLFEVEEGRLLCLPPGSDRFTTYRRIMPRIMDRHLTGSFPRLKAELANRPNLFFPGVFYPHEITIDNMEMVSLHHGRNYVVRTDLHLRDRPDPVTVALKPAPMAVEAVVTSLLEELNRRMSRSLRSGVGPIEVPEIVAVDEQYGILEYLPGRNGVEVLPRGINTGTLRTLRNNEYPEDFPLDREGLLELTDEFAKQAALAFYLRLYDRKPDQLILRDREGAGFDVAHIDFGRALKRNYALPWRRYYATQKPPLVFEDHQIPYFEAATSLIFLPHFIPRSLKDDLPPYEGPLRERIRSSFIKLAKHFRNNAEVIHEYLQYLVGNRTQFSEDEVTDPKISPRDVEEVRTSLLALDNEPEEVIDSVLNLARLERSGHTPTRPSDGRKDSLYHRGIRSGDVPLELPDRHDGEHPFDLRRYDEGNRVFYDPDSQTLEVTFGERPEDILPHLRRRFSPTLARFLEGFDRLIPGASLRIPLDGGGTVRVPPGWVQRDVSFPGAVLQEVRQAVSDFAAPFHLRNYVNEYRRWLDEHPDATFPKREIERQGLIFTNNLEGREILQCYLETESPDDPLHGALTDVVDHLLSNPEFLVDKDPLKSINDLVVHLGHKHGLVDPLESGDIPGDVADTGMYQEVFRRLNRSLPRGSFTGRAHPAIAHVRCMIRLGEVIVDTLDPSHRPLFRSAVLLHDLYLMDPRILEFVMDPNGRSNRPLIRGVLDRHPDRSRAEFHRLIEEGLDLPDDVQPTALADLLAHHHPDRWDHDPEGAAPAHLRQLLHVVDRLVSYADKTRPARWNQGSLQLEELAPTWVRTQIERHDLDARAERSLNDLLEAPVGRLREIDRVTDPFQCLANALHLAASLHDGLDPRNPDLLNELRDRHGEEVVDGIWERVLESNLPAREKVRLVRRIDDLAGLFARHGQEDYTFVNASPHPIQRARQLIGEHLAQGRRVILVGFFPRVTKAFRRFREANPGLPQDDLRRIVAVSGPRRLQFIRHSYPYEADFERPFHHTIRAFRNRHGIDTPYCFVPFVTFFEAYSPTTDATTRIRELEKASDLEDHRAPDRVRQEARRFSEWKASGNARDVDRVEDERLRRVLLNDFSNREVLYYYRETLEGRPNVRAALKDVQGALQENPNYLSERNSRYSLHELIRSLSQIHFYPQHRGGITDRLEAVLESFEITRSTPLHRLLERPGAEFDFLKHTLISGLELLDALPGDPGGVSDFSLAFSTLSPVLLCEDSALQDYLLSPEDISYHRTLRRRLLEYSPALVERIVGSQVYRDLPAARRSEVRTLLGEQTPPGAYSKVQTALFLALYGDFSRVENWERGRYRLLTRDLKAVLPTLASTVDRITHGESSPFFRRVESWVEAPSSVDLLNDLAGPAHSYVYLFNALNLASDLRYGLFPRGLNTFQNARRLFGSTRVNRVLNGLVRSRLSVVKAVKIARKIRVLAAALKRLPRAVREVRFLDLDRPWGGHIPPEDPSGPGRAVILTGNCRNVLAAWNVWRRADHRPAGSLYCLVGEEYPLFLKDTDLACSGLLRERIRRHRREEGLQGRHRLVPARVLLDGLDSCLTVTTAADRDRTTAGPATPFLTAYLDLFENGPRT